MIQVIKLYRNIDKKEIDIGFNTYIGILSYVIFPISTNTNIINYNLLTDKFIYYTYKGNL